MIFFFRLGSLLLLAPLSAGFQPHRGFEGSYQYTSSLHVIPGADIEQPPLDASAVTPSEATSSILTTSKGRGKVRLKLIEIGFFSSECSDAVIILMLSLLLGE